MSHSNSLPLNGEASLHTLALGLETLIEKMDSLVALLQDLKDRGPKEISSMKQPGSPDHYSQTAESTGMYSNATVDWRRDPKIADAIRLLETIRSTPEGKDAREFGINQLPYHTITKTEGLGVKACPFQGLTNAQGGKTPSCPVGQVQQTWPEQKEESPDAAALATCSSKPPSLSSIPASNSKCPIRFLDNQGPEEVAQYFKEHKHEIPRSHAICIKRYQANEESIRELDAKYGNLVSMIQGLGQKHQPLLPPDARVDNAPLNDDHEHGYAAIPEQKSMEDVTRWAEKAAVESREELDGVSHVRSGHFDRPLREVRLGESPSRPWGIHVPLAEQGDKDLGRQNDVNGRVNGNRSTTPSGESASSPTPSPRFAPEFKTSAGYKSNSERTGMSKKSRRRKISSGTPSIILNGPILFGYSSGEAVAFLKGLRDQVD